MSTNLEYTSSKIMKIAELGIESIICSFHCDDYFVNLKLDTGKIYYDKIELYVCGSKVPYTMYVLESDAQGKDFESENRVINYSAICKGIDFVTNQ